MSAIAQTSGPLRGPPSRAPATGPRADRYPPTGRAGFTFADALLAEQGIPRRTRRSEARALALLLARTLRRPDEPVVVSARDGGEECGFEPRTWWHVKRRLLERGHLLATTGGGPPSGRPGGRGRKGAYFVAPATLARFHEWVREQAVKAEEQRRCGSLETLKVAGESVNVAEQTVNARSETVKVRRETVKARAEESELSHHRPLRVLSKERTSDVPSFEGDEETADDGRLETRANQASRRAARKRSHETASSETAIFETVNVHDETVKVRGDGVKDRRASGFAPASALTPSSLARGAEAVSVRPTAAVIWAEIGRERSIRVKLALLRVLEVALLGELLGERESLGETVSDPRRAVGPFPASEGPVEACAKTVKDGSALTGSALASSPPTVGSALMGLAGSPASEHSRSAACSAPTGERSEQADLSDSPRASERPRGVRRRRAPAPLWVPEGAEAARVYAHVRSVLEWANREHRARFDVERSAKDTLRYPYETVRGAVANVLLKQARGYRFTNAGAVLWDGITLEGYKLEEFAAGPFDEVLARVGVNGLAGASVGGESGNPDVESVSSSVESVRGPARRPEAKLPAPRSTLPAPPLRFDQERRARLELQAAYEALPEGERAEIDRRAEALAREELGEMVSPPRLRLLQLDKRNELLRGRAEPGRDAMGREKDSDESQIPLLDSAVRRD